MTKRRILILLGDDDNEPYNILKIYDLDCEGEFECLDYFDGYENTDQDKQDIIDWYCEEYGFKQDNLDIHYIEKQNDGMKASCPDRQTAEQYFNESESLIMKRIRNK